MKTPEEYKTNLKNGIITELKEFVKNIDDSEINPKLTMYFIYPNLEKKS